MQFTENGNYELVTNGVQVIPVTVAVGEAPPVLDSIGNVKLTEENVKAAVDNKVELPSGKAILYNVVDKVGDFVMEINNSDEVKEIVGVFKYIILDGGLEYYINIAKSAVNQVLMIIQNLTVQDVIKYAFNLALMGIEYGVFL